MQNQGGVVGGTQSTDIGGATTAPPLSASSAATGTRSASPASLQTPTSRRSRFSAARARHSDPQAANRLSAGDVILIELHRPGPVRTAFTNTRRPGRLHRRRVVARRLRGDPVRHPGARRHRRRGRGKRGREPRRPSVQHAARRFPAAWTNPFNRANRDSGAILVGAGAPPPGTHGNNWGADRSRLDFSNWGAASTRRAGAAKSRRLGYGDLQGGANEDLWYTTLQRHVDASPIVVGALASVRACCARRAHADHAGAARAVLRRTGSPQQDAPGRPATQRIGNRPNFHQCSTSSSPRRRSSRTS